MSKEKQIIEDMALAICECRMVADVDNCRKCRRHEDCLYQEIAYGLYNAGYRKQKEGEWKDCFDGKYANATYLCSICGKGTLLKPDINELDNMEMVQALSPFCPNCGASMKGGAE